MKLLAKAQLVCFRGILQPPARIELSVVELDDRVAVVCACLPLLYRQYLQAASGLPWALIGKKALACQRMWQPSAASDFAYWSCGTEWIKNVLR